MTQAPNLMPAAYARKTPDHREVSVHADADSPKFFVIETLDVPWHSHEWACKTYNDAMLLLDALCRVEPVIENEHTA